MRVLLSGAVVTLSASVASSVVVYDQFLAEGQPRGNLSRSTLIPNNSPIPTTVQAFGDLVTLNPNVTERTARQFDFLMTNRFPSGVSADAPISESVVTFELRLFAAGSDGRPVGEPFYSSGPFERTLFVGRHPNPGFDIGEDQVISLDLSAANLLLPDTFVATVFPLLRVDGPGDGDGLITSIQFYTIAAAGSNGIGSTPASHLRLDFDGNWNITTGSTPRSAAFRMSVIPEPASASLIALAGMALLRRRR